jgi:3-deoxy-D-manno-octulosonic-acid transferase
MKYFYNQMFNALYSFLFAFVYLLAKLASPFSFKIRNFFAQRNSIAKDIAHFKKEEGQTVFWFHTASMGEFEQIKPLLGEIKICFPNAQSVVTFFSPSGYDIFKLSPLASAVSYLPLDRSKDLKSYLDKIQPDALFLVKYEFWPNLLKMVHQRNISIYSISSTFRKEQLFFKLISFGMRAMLKKVNYFFVLNKASRNLLNKISIKNVEIIGDTRFDRVLANAESARRHNIIEEFIGDKLCCIAGSTWPEDHALFSPIFQKKMPWKWIIAPHKVEKDAIAQLENTLPMKAAKWTTFNTKKDASKSILIIDCVGVLSTAYGHGDIAYVGGGMGTKGLHNTLEAAVFGIPVIIGKNYLRYPEANLLIQNGGMTSVKSAKEFADIYQQLITQKELRKKQGMANQNFIKTHQGATEKIISFLKTQFNT